MRCRSGEPTSRGGIGGSGWWTGSWRRDDLRRGNNGGVGRGACTSCGECIGGGGWGEEGLEAVDMGELLVCTTQRRRSELGRVLLYMGCYIERRHEIWTESGDLLLRSLLRLRLAHLASSNNTAILDASRCGCRAPETTLCRPAPPLCHLVGSDDAYSPSMSVLQRPPRVFVLDNHLLHSASGHGHTSTILCSLQCLCLPGVNLL